MTEKELKYYYPFRFISSRPHLKKIVEKIKSREDIDHFLQVIIDANIKQSKLEPNRWFDQAKLNIRAVTEIENIYSYSKFKSSGSNIFSFSKELLSLLEKTDVDEIEFRNIKHPYKNYYISFRNLDKDVKGTYMEFEHKLDGVYISNEIENSIILHLTGYNEEKKNKNWWYYPDFSNINTLDFIESENNVDFALKNLYQNLEQQLAFTDKDLAPNLESTFSEIERNIKLIINCILYLTSEKENLMEEYPKDIPNNYSSKLFKAKTNRQKKVVEEELKRNGFSKIRFATLGYDRNNNDNPNVEINPHWRRGHWRKQPFGIGLQETKMIWIKPTIVRKDKGEPTKGHIYDVKN